VTTSPSEELDRRIRVEIVVPSTRRVWAIWVLAVRTDIPPPLLRELRVRPRSGLDRPGRFVLSKGQCFRASTPGWPCAAIPVAELLTFDHWDRLQAPRNDRLRDWTCPGVAGLGISAAVASPSSRTLGAPTGLRLLGDGSARGLVWERLRRRPLRSGQLWHRRSHRCSSTVAGRRPEHGLPPEAPRELRPSGRRSAAVSRSTGTAWRDSRCAHQARTGDGRPIAIIATRQGQGVSFAEGRYEWHVKVPTPASTPRMKAWRDRRCNRGGRR